MIFLRVPGGLCVMKTYASLIVFPVARGGTTA